MAFAAVSLVTWNNLFGDTPRSFLEHPSFVHHTDTTTVQTNHNRPIAAGMGGMQWGQWLSDQSNNFLGNAQKNQAGDVAIAGLVIDHSRPIDRCMGRDLSMAIGQTHLALATQMADWGIHLGLSERVDVPAWQQLATPQNRHLMQPQSTTQLHAHLVHSEPLGLDSDQNPQPTGVLVVAVDNGIVSSLCYLPKK